MTKKDRFIEEYNFTYLEKAIAICDQVWDNNVSPLVQAIILTYNHEKYIGKCIDSILMQKTTFPVQILIHDDASTDKTSEIVRIYETKYPAVIEAIYQTENKYSQGVMLPIKHILSRTKGHYVAFCEGDDYWIDPLKLQKQVFFLEENLDCSLVHTELEHEYTVTGKYVNKHWESCGIIEQSGNLYENFLLGKKSQIYLCTVLARGDIVNVWRDLDFPGVEKVIAGDTLLALCASLKHKIGYINESTAVRRVLAWSATQGRSADYYLRFNESGPIVFEYFTKIRPVSEEIRREYYNNFYLGIINICFRYYSHKDKFDGAFSKLDKQEQRKLRLIRIGMQNALFNYIIKKILRIKNKFKAKGKK